MSTKAPKPITAVSTVIELKPGKKYLLLFQSEEDQALLIQRASSLLKEFEQKGIVGIGFALRKGERLEVIEAEGKK